MSRSAWLLAVCCVLCGCDGQRLLRSTAPATREEAPKAKHAIDGRIPFELTPGVVVDPEHPAVYVMRPGGGAEALDISSGTVLWTTDRAAKPLGIHEGHLFCQTEGGEEMSLVALATRDGVKARRFEIPLPDGVSALVSNRDGQSFRAEIRVHGDTLLVSWNFVAWVPTATDTGGSTTLSRQVNGQAQVHLGSGKVDVLEKEEHQPPPEEPLPPAVEALTKSRDLPGPIWHAGPVLASPVRGPEGEIILQRFDAKSGENLPEKRLFGRETMLRFPSADKRHLLASRRLEGDRSTWQWVLFSLETGEPVGEVRVSVEGAMFCIVDSTLLSVIHDSTRLKKEPRPASRVRLDARDLKTGALRWSRPVRDLAVPLSAPPGASGG